MNKFFYVVFILLLLIGCSKDVTKPQQLKELLIDINEKETQGSGVEKDLYQQEQKEQEMFLETMELTQQQYKEVKQQVAALEKSVHERTVLLEKEENNMKEAKIAVDQLSQWTKQMGDIPQLESLVVVLYERSDKHESFVSEYKSLIDSQTQLYTLLEDRTIRESELQKHVSEVNELTESSKQLLSEFNEETEEVNRLATLAFESLEQQK